MQSVFVDTKIRNDQTGLTQYQQNSIHSKENQQIQRLLSKTTKTQGFLDNFLAFDMTPTLAAELDSFYKVFAHTIKNFGDQNTSKLMISTTEQIKHQNALNLCQTIFFQESEHIFHECT